MKKFLAVLIINLLGIASANSQPNYYFGKGDINLSNNVVDYFINYIKKKLNRKSGDDPVTFWVTEDGNNSYWWTSDGNSCNRTWDNEIYIVSRGDIITFGVADMCRGKQHVKKFGKECKAYHKQECKLFARNRTIIWNNGINEGIGKNSKINSRWSDQEIIARLTELGFIGTLKKNTISKSDSTSASSSVKKKKNVNVDQQLLDLLELYDSGILNKEELLQVWKKIVNSN